MMPTCEFGRWDAKLAALARKWEAHYLKLGVNPRRIGALVDRKMRKA